MRCSFVVGLIGSLACNLALAKNADVDWKFFGGTPPDLGRQLCFFESLSIVRSADLLRVWTKCLPEPAVIELEKDDEILNHTAKKISKYYDPPYMVYESKDFNIEQIMEITVWEEIADSSSIQPPTRIYYEIDCGLGKIRTLSVSMDIDGRHGSENSAGEWSYIGPEGNDATLRKILCNPK